MSQEKALAQQEMAVDGLLKALSKYSSAVKGWKKACQIGHIGNLHKASTLAVELGRALPEITEKTKAEWIFDVRAYLDSDEWLAELQEAASNTYDLRTIRDNDTLTSSPLTVRSQPARASLALGRTSWPAIRPRVVTAELKRLRD